MMVRFQVFFLLLDFSSLVVNEVKIKGYSFPDLFEET